MPDDDIVVIRQPVTQVVVSSAVVPVSVQQTNQQVSASSPGPQGPIGPQGPPGTPGGTVYDHDQAIASSTWVITHGLGVYPDVTVIVSGEEVYPDVIHNSLNQVSLVFASPRAGTARLRP